jgi:hypothetical protein
MDQTKVFSEMDEHIRKLRKIILKHARTEDLYDDEFLIDLHQVTHRILTLKRMMRNGKSRSEADNKNRMEHLSATY